MKIDFARESALKILYKIEEENGYSNLALDEYIEEKREKLNYKDINLISEIVYGTISWKLTIDTIIEKYSKVKLNKISKWVKIILQIGIYQIVFLDKIPKSAAVNESVNLCKKYGYKSANFVNAILRKVEKEDYEELKQIEDSLERISKMYSMPKWIVQKLINQYGEKQAEEICKNSNFRPNVTIRVNTLKTNANELKQLLEERKIEYEESKLENFIHLKNIKNVSNLDLFINGYFTIQDEGAGKIGYVLNPKQGENVLDACSAPGGKTTHMAEIMQNDGKILALDIYDHRLKLVEENAKRLGISIIKTQKKDATQYYNEYKEKFDKVLLDVPCLGIGVLKRKPDIKWQKQENDVLEIQNIQEQILNAAGNYLKVGGELVYSTCSILKEENEDVITKFLKKENEKMVKFEVIEQENILPSKNTDGFFICKLKKVL
jgi:16S rRNA (cytosine967-C5)-methyltransferase